MKWTLTCTSPRSKKTSSPAGSCSTAGGVATWSGTARKKSFPPGGSLLDRRWSCDMVRHRAGAESWRTIHSGVYTRLQGPLTQRQRWIAAVLTARITYLDGLSAAACYGFHEWE